MFELSQSEPEFSKINTSPFGEPEAKEMLIETDGENPQHPGVLRAFAAKILGKGELVARGQEGLNGLMISNAIHLSAWLNKEIELPFDEHLFYNELMKRVNGSRARSEKKK